MITLTNRRVTADMIPADATALVFTVAKGGTPGDETVTVEFKKTSRAAKMAFNKIMRAGGGDLREYGWKVIEKREREQGTMAW